MSTRASYGAYADPVDLIWLSLAKRLGFQIHRADDAYASFDGDARITICTEAEFDGDDCLAQMILHELCHALVGGKKALRTRDWGLVGDDGDDLLREHATHRLQAHLSNRFGLRHFFAVTTQWRSHYDSLEEDPLKGDEPASQMARQGLENARAWGWEEPIAKALEATAKIAEIVQSFTPPHSLWEASEALHPTGFPLSGDQTCGECAWGEAIESSNHVHCQHSCEMMKEPVQLSRDTPSCQRFEEKFGEHECSNCGACCREGFDAVPVGPEELLNKLRPDLLVRDGDFVFIPRPNGYCSGLQPVRERGWRCDVYEIRPKGCRDLEIGSIGCLQARRKVDLSRG